MGGWASSSRKSRKRGGGESVVVDEGKMRTTCDYCKSTDYTSISHGVRAHSMTVDDYQDLLDRGWRRAGCYLYKPEMDRTCCPSYTIRLKASDFVPSKEQLRVDKKMQRYLDGAVNTDKAGLLKEKADSSRGSVNMVRDASSTPMSLISKKDSSAGICQDQKDKFIDYLSNKIDEAISLCARNGEFSSPVQFPKAVVKQVTHKAKRKLVEESEDLLYTSSISFQIAAVLRRTHLIEAGIGPIDSANSNGKVEPLNNSPNIIAEKLACIVADSKEQDNLRIKACNGHLNFYSASMQDRCSLLRTNKIMQTAKDNAGKCEQSSSNHSGEVLPSKKQKLEIQMKRSTFDPEEFDLYKRYQMKVHNDKPEKVTESSYKRFLVDTPLVFVPPHSRRRPDVPRCGFGSFHQQYLVDGKLVAVGVVDILPKCLSSKYLFWDPDLAFLSLGKYSALQEINWIKEAQVYCPSLQYYYLGYYIHSCPKMRYKAAYRPSELLCPLRYVWVPFEKVQPLLGKRSYIILSDYMALKVDASSPQLPNTSIDGSASPDKKGIDKPFSDEDEEIDLDLEMSDTDLDSESNSKASSAIYKDDLALVDVNNIVLDLNGSRVRFKDLERRFGPTEKRHINGLGMQLRGYVRVVGEELSSRMVYSLGRYHAN